MNRLAGKVAIITGGAQGMGASHAEIFAAEGARVVIADVREAEGRALAKRLGETCRFRKLDVSSSEDWPRIIADTEADWGKIDILVNNAGIAREALLEEASDEHYNELVATNQTGVFKGMRAVIPAMRRAKGGSIVNISSISSMTGHSKGAVYAATKGAVEAITRAAAIELAPHCIRVNSVHPGIIRTPMIEGVGVTDVVSPLIPMGRIGEPRELSMLVLFLASDESSYSTGVQFVADGGYSAQ
jgi:3alpha(or 20beta)-hydroxysteroid dehydrogenase